MSKKFGVSIAFISAFAFFCGWYNFTWLLVGTILVLVLCEEEKLRKNVLNAFFLSFILLIANMVLNWISARYIGILNSILNTGWDWLARIYTIKVHNVFVKLDICSYLAAFLRFAEFVLMVVFVILSLSGKEVNVPIANTLALKVMGLAPVKEKKVKEEKENAEEKEEENPLTSDKATLTEIPENEK